MTKIDPRYPLEIHDIWSTLKSEVVWLHGRWIIYCQLFGMTPERVELLNRSASTFFNVFQKTMLHDVQLSLSKLGDPAESGKRRNLTLSTLQIQLESIGETKLCGKLVPLIKDYGAVCTKIRRRRNKWIAHFDLDTMLSSKVKPLQGPSRNEIEAALTALRKVMNQVELHFTGNEVIYEHFVMNHDGERLTNLLKRGLRYEELVRKGEVARDDLRKNFK